MKREDFVKVAEETLDSAAGRVPQPHPECRDSGRGFSGEPATTEDWGSKGGCFFRGVPTTKRSVFNLPTGPDHIVLYQKNIEAVCSSEAEVRHQIRQTLSHT